jgi:hypothetical protein
MWSARCKQGIFTGSCFRASTFFCCLSYFTGMNLVLYVTDFNKDCGVPFVIFSWVYLPLRLLNQVAFCECEDGCLLRCSAVWSGRRLPTFQRYFLPPSSGLYNTEDSHIHWWISWRFFIVLFCLLLLETTTSLNFLIDHFRGLGVERR